MPPSTVTVRAVASNATILAIGRTERNSSVLFAMLLKQCRVPSTFSLLCFGTNSRTCSSDSAEYKRSVPYSRLPAQFFSFSSGIAAINGERIGLAAIAEVSLINVLLFMVSHQTGKKVNAKPPSSDSAQTQIAYAQTREIRFVAASFAAFPRESASGARHFPSRRLQAPAHAAPAKSDPP